MRSANDLLKFFEVALGRPVFVVVNQNVQSLIASKMHAPSRRLRISIHEMFQDAPEEILHAVADVIGRRDPRARTIVRHFINDQLAAAKQEEPRAEDERPGGQHFDLRALADDLNREYFGGELEFSIGWGRMSNPRGRKRQRHLTLGTANSRRRAIRIHPVLDDPKVPVFFLQFVIHHEMSHLAVPARRDSAGRLLHHTSEFYRMERRFSRYMEATAWQDANLGSLLARAAGAIGTASAAQNSQLGLF